MSKKVTITIYALLGLLLVAIIAAAAVIITSGNQEHSEALSELDRLNDQLESEGAQLELTVEGLSEAKAQLEAEVASLKAKITELETSLTNSDSYYREQYAALTQQIADKNNEIAALEADIARFTTVFTIDVRAQAQLIDEIINYIETQCPYVRMVDEPEEGTEEAEQSEDAEIVYKWVAVADLVEEMRLAAEEAGEEFPTEEELEEMGLTEAKYFDQLYRPQILAREDVYYPSVSVYYEDLATGYHFDYEADVVYNSASVIKAPYILSVLQAISADEKKYLASLEAKGEVPEKVDTDGDGTPDTVKIEYSNPIYDLSETVVYDSKTMLKEGSGKIKDMADGTEFSYLDFVKYALEYSDNVAYQQLRNRFGFTRMYTLASKVGANSVVRNGNNMTARDAGKLFKAIYEFTEEDETYGAIMKTSMRKGNHTVIIPYGVYPTATLHKYGWDKNSYHDAAIVLYSDKPYVLTVFTDLDNGGNEVNAYLQGIVKLIHKLHKGFYS